MEDRSTWTAIQHGLRLKCPACGQGPLYSRYLTSVERCSVCGTDLHHHRADDAPAYVTILVVAHIIGAGILFTEMTWHPAEWVHWIIWIPLLLVLSLFLLPRFKGALIGIQWANRMHGFGGPDSDVTFADGAVKKPLG